VRLLFAAVCVSPAFGVTALHSTLRILGILGNDIFKATCELLNMTVAGVRTSNSICPCRLRRTFEKASIAKFILERQDHDTMEMFSVAS